MGNRTLTGPATRRIGVLLTERKEAEGWTFDDLIKRTSMPRATLQRALSGNNALAVETLIPIALGMGLDPAALIREGQRARAEAERPTLSVVEMSDPDENFEESSEAVAAHEDDDAEARAVALTEQP